MKIRHACAVAFALCLYGGISQAQDANGTYGTYLRLEGGWNHTSGVDLHGGAGALNGSTSEQEGWLGGGAVGYGFGQFRLELNFDDRNNTVRSVHVSGPGGFPAGIAGASGGGGTVQGITEMINGLYDLPVSYMGVIPYVGAGAGWANVKLHNLGVGGVQLVNDSDNMAAVQGIAGVRYNLTPQWGLGLEYRFLNGFDPAYVDRTGHGFSTSDYRNSSVLLSISYSFGAPPSPPPPTPVAAAPPPPPPPMAPQPPAAPAAAARQMFLVFFDFGKATLTDAGRQVVDAAAAAYKRNQSVRIDVTGYTDTVGSQEYNLGLSHQRADAVRAYLAKQGVPASAVNEAWKGKEDLRVPTPNDVREPQNRRVEIVFP